MMQQHRDKICRCLAFFGLLVGSFGVVACGPTPTSQPRRTSGKLGTLKQKITYRELSHPHVLVQPIPGTEGAYIEVLVPDRVPAWKLYVSGDDREVSRIEAVKTVHNYVLSKEAQLCVSKTYHHERRYRQEAYRMVRTYAVYTVHVTLLALEELARSVALDLLLDYLLPGPGDLVEEGLDLLEIVDETVKNAGTQIQVGVLTFALTFTTALEVFQNLGLSPTSEKAEGFRYITKPGDPQYDPERLFFTSYYPVKVTYSDTYKCGSVED